MAGNSAPLRASKGECPSPAAGECFLSTRGTGFLQQGRPGALPTSSSLLLVVVGDATSVVSGRPESERSHCASVSSVPPREEQGEAAGSCFLNSKDVVTYLKGRVMEMELPSAAYSPDGYTD